MLDAFIIQRIREEQKRSQERGAEPLPIEVPREEPIVPIRRQEQAPAEEQGIAEIDFSI